MDSLSTYLDHAEGMSFQCLEQALGSGSARTRGDKIYHDYYVTCSKCGVDAQKLMVIVNRNDTVAQVVWAVP